ncbi:MAG: hypothetical protein WB586_12705 [Chthoniobacterales bacterium]
MTVSVASSRRCQRFLDPLLSSLYEPGRRSGAWLKVKLTQEQEFVVRGYTPPEGSRKYFGPLLVGYYSPAGLLFVGGVGTGFSEKALEHLYEGMQEIKRATALLLTCQRKDRADEISASPLQS